jgi:hypothetical protein
MSFVLTLARRVWALERQLGVMFCIPGFAISLGR